MRPFISIAIVVIHLSLVELANGQLMGRDILALPPEKRLSVVRAAVRSRVTALDNVDVHVVQDLNNIKVLSDGTVTKRMPPNMRQEYHLWKKGSSYRETCIESNLPTNEVMFTWDSNYDAESGVVRSFTTPESKSKRIFGRIGYQQNSAIQFNQFAFYLPGMVEDLLTYHELILSDKVVTTVEDELGPEGEVIVRTSPPNVPANDTRYNRYWLRPDHGFAITRFQERNIFPARNDNFGEGGEVTDEAEVDGVWFPMRIVHRVCDYAAGTGTEFVCTVKSVELGKVKEEDLAVVFPPNCEVDNQIQQKAYVEGEEEITTVSYAGKDSYTPPISLLRKAQAENPPSRSWYLWGNVVLVVAIGLVIVYRQRRYSVHA